MSVETSRYQDDWYRRKDLFNRSSPKPSPRWLTVTYRARLRPPTFVLSVRVCTPEARANEQDEGFVNVGPSITGPLPWPSQRPFGLTRTSLWRLVTVPRTRVTSHRVVNQWNVTPGGSLLRSVGLQITNREFSFVDSWWSINWRLYFYLCLVICLFLYSFGLCNVSSLKLH